MNSPAHYDNTIIEYLLSALDAPLAEPPMTESQHRYIAQQVTQILNKMPGGFFIYRADEKEEIIYANEALLRIFNCDTYEEFRMLTGNSFRGIVHPDDLEEVELSIRRQIAHSTYDLDYVEYRIIQKGGEIRWVDDYGHFIHSKEAGDIFYVFVGDATDKKKSLEREKAEIEHRNIQNEQKWQQRLEQYDKELETVNQELLRRLEMIEGLSMNYESIFYVNLAMDRIQPYRISERITKQFGTPGSVFPFSSFCMDYAKTWVYPQDQKKFLEATTPDYLRQKLAKETAFYFNYRVTGDTDAEYLQMRVVDIGKDERGSQIILGYRRLDDEIRHEMEQKKILEDALQQAKAAIIAKDTFLANMSHDLRTPVNAIVGFTALAHKNIRNLEKVQQYLDRIQTSSQQLLNLINDLLDLSRVESGDIHFQETNCNLLDILEDAAYSANLQAKAKDISFTLDTSRLVHFEICSDRQELTQLLLRFTDNAVKYTKAGGSVSLTALEQPNPSSDYGTYQFIIEDNGVGIRQDFIPHIFEPFERQANSTLSGIHGTGLGLTIAKNITERLGGNIAVSSQSGKGSRFTISLQLRLQQKTPLVSSHTALLPPDPEHPCNILVVEDNELNREIEVEILQDAGFSIDTAEDGSIAVEKIKNSKPGDYSLILMDIQMPVMNGYQAAQAIRQLPSPELAGIPIIALSANAFEEDRRRSVESGMNAHMTKPFSLPDLLDLIQEMLHNSPTL